MNLGTPFAILSIIYTESSHKESRVKNDVIRRILSAVSSEKSMQREHFNILPPSRDVSGIKLKIDRQRERIEKGKRKFWQKGILRFINAIL